MPPPLAQLTGFLKGFRLVVHIDGASTQAIWEDTRLTEAIIGEDGTLFDPHVGDAHVEWANRDQLRNAPRELVTYLKENELIHPKF